MHPGRREVVVSAELQGVSPGRPGQLEGSQVVGQVLLKAGGAGAVTVLPDNQLTEHPDEGQVCLLLDHPENEHGICRAEDMLHHSKWSTNNAELGDWRVILPTFLGKSCTQRP